MVPQGVRVGEGPGSAVALSLAQAARVNVEGGCALPDPCDSGPCPPHSFCSDDWDSFSCRCHPGGHPLAPPHPAVTPALPPLHCHPCADTPALTPLALPPPALPPLWCHRWHCHPCAAIPGTATTVLPPLCCHSSRCHPHAAIPSTATWTLPPSCHCP